MNVFVDGLAGRWTWEPGKPILFGFDEGWTKPERDAVASAMKAWEAVANVDFKFATGHEIPRVVLRFGNLSSAEGRRR